MKESAKGRFFENIIRMQIYFKIKKPKDSNAMVGVEKYYCSPFSFVNKFSFVFSKYFSDLLFCLAFYLHLYCAVL